MSNNGQDQQLFSMANTLIKRVKIFLPESIKDCFMKDTCKQEQNEPQTKVFCLEDGTFVSYHNQFHLSAAAKDPKKHVRILHLVFSYRDVIIHRHTGRWVDRCCVKQVMVKWTIRVIEGVHAICTTVCDLVYFHSSQIDLMGLRQSYYFTPAIIHLIIKMRETIEDKKLLWV